MANHFIDNFLKNLNTSETAAVTRYLKNNISNAEESKTFEVFRKLTSGEEIRYENKTALNKLKSRIFEKSLDALMMDEQYLSATFCEFDYKLLELKKKLVKVRILQLSVTQSKTDLIYHLVNEIIEEAKKYEIYTIINEALLIKKHMIAGRSNATEIQQVDNEIAFYKSCEIAAYEVVDCYNILIRNEGLNSQLTEKEIINHISNSIRKMEKDLSYTNSEQINYYLFIMKFAFYEKKKDFDKCISICKELIGLLKKSKPIYRVERMGFALDNLSLFYLRSFNYKMAEKAVVEAESFFLPGSHNAMVCLEEKFHIFFHQGKYKEAQECLDKIMAHPISDAGKFRNAKFTFYKIYMLFTQKRFKECIQLANKPLEIEKSKSKWRIALDILKVMTFVEIAYFDSASRALDAIRKYIERNKSDEKIKERDLLIVRALRELEKSSFEYDPQNPALVKIIKQLSAKNTAVSWEHCTPELIPFHEWLGKRIK